MNKISHYLKQFQPIAKEWFAQRPFVRENYGFFRSFFEEDNLNNAEWSDIQRMGEHLHCFGSMAIARVNALGNPNHQIEHYRSSFVFLAHGDGDPAKRIREFTNDPQYKLKYFGPSAVSELAGYLFPEHFFFANSRDLFALQFLGIPVDKTAAGDALGYLRAFAKAAQPVAKLYEEIVGSQTDLPLNLEVDQFFSWLYEEHAGATGASGAMGAPKTPDVELDQIMRELSGESSGTRTKPRFWTISAGEGGEHWEEFYDSAIAAIGWDKLGDLKQYPSKEAIRVRLVELLSSRTNRSNDALACWQFAHEMQIGDVVLAKQGFTSLLGCGVVVGDYRFEEQRAHYQHVHRVRWLVKGSWKLPEDNKVASKALTDVTRFEKFLETVGQIVGLDWKDLPEAVDDLLQAADEKPEAVNDLSEVVEGQPEGPVQYWWLNANPKVWNFDDLPVGGRQTYTSHNEKGHKRQKYRWFQQVRPGDMVVGYVSTPVKEVMAICRITRGLQTTATGETIEFEKVERLSNSLSWATLQSHPDLATAEPILSNQGSLFRLKEEEYDLIRSLIDDTASPFTPPLPYTKQEAMQGLFMAESHFDEMLLALREKKNVVLQGAPGVGKTFVARRLAHALLEARDPSRVEMIQFHQSYSYEDFIQGFRPNPKGHFTLRNGVFHEFCRRARREEDLGRPYVFIIDEINRGNLSKIFGELLMLIEPDKRGVEYALPLTYAEDNEERFYIPKNLYILGMMNTADRSLAMVDYALRRRFRFITLKPAFESLAFRTALQEQGAEPELVHKIVSRMGELNQLIASDSKNLGPGYQIGHSFFCSSPETTADAAWFERVVETEIVPLLQEYWFDDERKVEDSRGRLLR